MWWSKYKVAKAEEPATFWRYRQLFAGQLKLLSWLLALSSLGFISLGLWAPSGQGSRLVREVLGSSPSLLFVLGLTGIPPAIFLGLLAAAVAPDGAQPRSSSTPEAGELRQRIHDHRMDMFRVMSWTLLLCASTFFGVAAYLRFFVPETAFTIVIGTFPLALTVAGLAALAAGTLLLVAAREEGRRHREENLVGGD